MTGPNAGTAVIDDIPRDPQNNSDNDQGLSTPTYLHMDEHHKVYALTEKEIDDLASCGQNTGKEFFLTTAGLAVPTLMNAHAIYEASEKTTVGFTPGLNFTLNMIVGFCSFALCLFYVVEWVRTHTKSTTIVTQIKNKPRRRS